MTETEFSIVTVKDERCIILSLWKTSLYDESESVQNMSPLWKSQSTWSFQLIFTVFLPPQNKAWIMSLLKYFPLFWVSVFSAVERCEPAVGPGGLRWHQKDQSSLHWHLAAWSGSLQQVRYQAIFDLGHVPLFISINFTQPWRNNHHTWKGYFESHFPILQNAACKSSDCIRLNLDVLQVPPPPPTICCIWHTAVFPWQPAPLPQQPMPSWALVGWAVRQQHWPILRHWRPPALIFNLVSPMLMLCLSVPTVLTVTLPSFMRPKCCWSTQEWSRGTHLPSSRATVKLLCCISPLTSRTAAWSWAPGPTTETWSSSIL